MSEVHELTPKQKIFIRILICKKAFSGGKITKKEVISALQKSGIDKVSINLESIAITFKRNTMERSKRGLAPLVSSFRSDYYPAAISDGLKNELQTFAQGIIANKTGYEGGECLDRRNQGGTRCTIFDLTYSNDDCICRLVNLAKKTSGHNKEFLSKRRSS